MARKQLKTADGEGFLRALWDSFADMEVEYGVTCSLTVTPTTRKGVFRWRMAAQTMAGTPLASESAVYTGEYPSVVASSLEAFLYRSSLKLEHILEQQRKWPMGKA